MAINWMPTVYEVWDFCDHRVSIDKTLPWQKESDTEGTSNDIIIGNGRDLKAFMLTVWLFLVWKNI